MREVVAFSFCPEAWLPSTLRLLQACLGVLGRFLRSRRSEGFGPPGRQVGWVPCFSRLLPGCFCFPTLPVSDLARACSGIGHGAVRCLTPRPPKRTPRAGLCGRSHAMQACVFDMRACAT